MGTGAPHSYPIAKQRLFCCVQGVRNQLIKSRQRTDRERRRGWGREREARVMYRVHCRWRHWSLPARDLALLFPELEASTSVQEARVGLPGGCEWVRGGVPLLGRHVAMWKGNLETAAEQRNRGGWGVCAAPSSAPAPGGRDRPWEGHACLGVGRVARGGGSVVAVRVESRLRMSRLTEHTRSRGPWRRAAGHLLPRVGALARSCGRAPGKGSIPLPCRPASEIAGQTEGSAFFLAPSDLPGEPRRVWTVPRWNEFCSSDGSSLLVSGVWARPVGEAASADEAGAPGSGWILVGA